MAREIGKGYTPFNDTDLRRQVVPDTCSRLPGGMGTKNEDTI